MSRTFRNRIWAAAGVAAVVLLLLNWKIAEDIHLEAVAFGYEPQGSGGRPVETRLTGSYDPDKKQFRGSWTIGTTEFPHVLFTNGLSAIAYRDKERIPLGNFIFEPDSGRYVITLTNPDLIRSLFPGEQAPTQLRLAAPAQNRQEAEAVYQDLNSDPAASR
ncbi:hypothetical protein [Paenibacillus glufosinatiresistens]|uniref:hypothetical protein n=1 Tax=Paenibacillus glufosinatiresistens TaxID=3070657 RepID=UPI00286DC071|nr:hypothetical protein [Paenibacillus sp. YX.27]